MNNRSPLLEHHKWPVLFTARVKLRYTHIIFYHYKKSHIITFNIYIQGNNYGIPVKFLASATRTPTMRIHQSRFWGEKPVTFRLSGEATYACSKVGTQRNALTFPAAITQ